MHKSFSATNHKGENAHIVADIVNAGYWEYNQPVISTDATSASVSGFGLTATDADSIKCTAGVSNRKINKANAIVEVYGGSLINYQADASARSDGVALSQSFDQASGDRIAVSERASNPTGYASTKTNVEDGSLFGYSNEGSTYANSQSLQTLGQFDEAIGEKIASESSGYKSCGYRSNSKMNVESTESQDGQAIAYYSQAGVDLFGLKTVSLQAGEEFTGNTDIDEEISDPSKRATAKIKISGTWKGYKPPEKKEGQLKIEFDSANGRSIFVELAAECKYGFTKDTIEILGDAAIDKYSGLAKAGKEEASVSSSCGSSLIESIKGMHFTWKTEASRSRCGVNEWAKVETKIGSVSIKQDAGGQLPPISGSASASKDLLSAKQGTEASKRLIRKGEDGEFAARAKSEFDKYPIEDIEPKAGKVVEYPAGYVVEAKVVQGNPIVKAEVRDSSGH
ncbi:MAG: hypothetical protein PHW87_13305 [Methanothrix sp.]|nr:hypothetical protein [Methanothrix sp.]